ncbi:hypothetical protein DSO57_1011724 [Entomophthora muscae]|uniref:Uncharacterized protein n=1 Tax=Entomophthora muscae TaxID=34485 RepID=A0ACC2T6D5_9FUNG|nr:hypothetical protein DSO57_1011724 [Entomophthora muscae]
MSEVIDAVNNRFSPCLLVGPPLTSCLAELLTVVTTYGCWLDVTERHANQANSMSTRTSDTLATLEENFCQLWEQQPPLNMKRNSLCVSVKSLPPLALDRTIFLCCTKKSAQKLTKPLNSLEDLAHTVDEKFVLAYPSQVVNSDALNSFPT